MSHQAKDELQTLHRGLKALHFMNEVGAANLATMARHLGVPRSNAHRIMTTLVRDGYLMRPADSRDYRLTARVRELAMGFDDDDVLAGVARGPMQRLGHEIVWPLALATPFGAEMLVRVTTDQQSPVALTRYHAGFRTPMLLTTTGLLVLAFSPQTIRDQVIDVIAARGDLAPYFPTRTALSATLKKIRADGFAISDTRYAEGNLGVPLIWGERVMGGLVVRYIKSVMTRAKVLGDLLPRLQALAAETVTAFDAAMRPNTGHSERRR